MASPIEAVKAAYEAVSPLECAAWLISAGLRPVPLRTDKRPLGKGWLKRPVGYGVLDECAPNGPATAVGVVPGPGFVVVDVDVKDGKKGKESWMALKAPKPRHAVATPSGGRHFWFAARPATGDCLAVGRYGGLDVRHNTGFVQVHLGGLVRWPADEFDLVPEGLEKAAKSWDTSEPIDRDRVWCIDDPDLWAETVFHWCFHHVEGRHDQALRATLALARAVRWGQVDKGKARVLLRDVFYPLWITQMDDERAKRSRGELSELWIGALARADQHRPIEKWEVRMMYAWRKEVETWQR